jgi:hypothetical protein
MGMMRKLFWMAALSAALLFPSVTLAVNGHPAAPGGHWHLHLNGRWHWHPGRPHYWHGRWWEMGVGPCWRQDPYYGLSIWTCIQYQPR